MATAANPLAAAIQSRLAQLQGGAPVDSVGAPGSGSPDDQTGISQQLQQQSSELHGADPSLIMRQLKKFREGLGVMFIQTFQAMPNVAGHISKTMATLDRAIKESESAAQTASAVRPPLGFSLAQQSPAGPSGQMGAGV